MVEEEDEEEEEEGEEASVCSRPSLDASMDFCLVLIKAETR
jgi:hypothetical protein